MAEFIQFDLWDQLLSLQRMLANRRSVLGEYVEERYRAGTTMDVLETAIGVWKTNEEPRNKLRGILPYVKHSQ